MEEQQDPIGPVTDLEEIADQPTVTFQDIYNELLIHEDVYLTHILRTDIEKLKKGLSNLKAKDNAKARIAGLPATETRRIEFEVMELDGDDYNPQYVKIHVFFKEPIQIIGKIIPADKGL